MNDGEQDERADPHNDHEQHQLVGKIDARIDSIQGQMDAILEAFTTSFRAHLAKVSVDNLDAISLCYDAIEDVFRKVEQLLNTVLDRCKEPLNDPLQNYEVADLYHNRKDLNQHDRRELDRRALQG